MSEHSQPSRDRSASSASHSSQNNNQNEHQSRNQGAAQGNKTGRGNGKEVQLDKETEERLRREWTGYAPLPAVKGTMGGIETPRRARHLGSPSISTVCATPRLTFDIRRPTPPSPFGRAPSGSFPPFSPSPLPPFSPQPLLALRDRYMVGILRRVSLVRDCKLNSTDNTEHNLTPAPSVISCSFTPIFTCPQPRQFRPE